MGEEKPLDREDDEPRPKRSRRPVAEEPPETPQERRGRERRNFNQLKWALLIIGSLLVYVTFQVPAVQAGAFAGLACFAAIVTRIAQAEEHRRD